MEYTELYLLVSGGGDSVIQISKINLHTYTKILNIMTRIIYISDIKFIIENSTCFTVSSSKSRRTSAGVRVNMIIACSSVLAWVRVTFNDFCKIINLLCNKFLCLIEFALSSKHNT